MIALDDDGQLRRNPDLNDAIAGSDRFHARFPLIEYRDAAIPVIQFVIFSCLIFLSIT